MHNTKFIRCIVATVAILTGVISMAGAPRLYPYTSQARAAVTDSLEVALANADNSADSIRLMFDLFDLARGNRRRPLLTQIYTTAKAVGDTASMLDAIKYQANLARRDTIHLARLRQHLEKMYPTPEVREIDLFVRLFQSENSIAADTVAERSRHIAELIRKYLKTPPKDNNERIEQLFTLCLYLGNSTRGELLRTYVNKLDSLVHASDLPVGAVRNLIYTRAAPIFTNAGTADIAVEIDKRTLNIIDSLDQSYTEIGRDYRNFDAHRYQCYRRLLANYKELTNPEVEQYHHDILQLAAVNPDIAADLRYNKMVDVSYFMAKKQYAAAVNAIRQALTVPGNQQKYRFYLYNALLEASTAIGNREMMLEAAVALNDDLNKMLLDKEAERYRELQITYDLNELQLENNNLEFEKHRALIRTNRIIMIMVGLALLLFIGLAILLQRQKRRSIRLTKELGKTIQTLTTERNELRQAQAELILARDNAKSADKLKTDFINNMSHEVITPLNSIMEYTHLIVDCIPDDKRSYLDRFADIIDRNTELVMTIMNDILDSSALENGSMTVHPEPTSIYRICELALDNVFEDGKSRKENITVLFNTPSAKDELVVTDPRRVAQVLINLLKNAEKFSDEGTITLNFFVDRALGRLTFAVEDKGIGIPRGKENEIFNRFRQLDASVPGCGMGLYISRLIAKLLDGTITVDTSYSRGARFLFTISL